MMTRRELYNYISDEKNDGRLIKKHVTLSPGWYKEAFLPVILSKRDDKSRILAMPGLFGGYWYRDPATNKRHNMNAGRSALFSDDALMVYRTFGSGPISSGDVIRFRLSHIAFNDILWFLIITFASVFAAMLIPWLTRILTQDAVDQGSVGLVISVALSMLVAALVSRVLSVIKSFLESRVGEGSRIALEAASMHRVMSLSLWDLQKYPAGELKQRMESITVMSDIFVNNFIIGTITTLSSMMFVFQIKIFGSSLLVPSLIILSGTFVLSMLTTFISTNTEKKRMDAQAKRSGVELDMMRGIEKIRHTGSEAVSYKRWQKLYDSEAAYRYRPPVFLRISPAMITAVKLAGTIVLYYKAASSGMHISDYLAFAAAYGGLTGAFAYLERVVLSLAQAVPVKKLALPVMNASYRDENEGEDIGDIKGDIVIDHVSFGYNEGDWNVINDLSVHIRPGEVVGITGPTGCGKTTLIRLILGLITPLSGEIRYDGHRLEEVNITKLRKQLGVVMQDGRLFAADIYSNVTIADPGIGEDQVWEALRIAHLDSDVQKLPLGLYSQIFENRNGISGGQKQRLLIAQAVVHRPKVLIMDEATSSLDAALEGEILDAVREMGCTVIIVAHRESALNKCDRVINI